jgi:hypothetical protein
MSLRRKEATDPSSEPICPASVVLQRIVTARATATVRIAKPTSEATISPLLPFPLVARRARATTGRASLKNVFHTNVIRADRAIAESGNPHDRHMA